MHLLHPFVSPRLEPTFRKVCDLAFANGVPVLQRTGGFGKDGNDILAKIAFFSAVHDGFRQAQDLVIENLLTRQKSTDLAIAQEEIAFRKIADGIAWQLLKGQLYIARRLCRNRQPTILVASEIPPLRAAAQHAEGNDLTKFALIADATSFVHVTDLLVADPLAGRYLFVEVKTGRANEAVLNFVHSAEAGDVEQQLADLHREYGTKAIEQVGRVLRQMGRMAHVEEVLRKGKSKDPDTGFTIHVPEETLVIESFDDRISQALELAMKRGWAIDVVDDCLFIGAYNAKVKRAGRRAFDTWLAGEGWKPEFPVANILECMREAVALPIYCRKLSSDQIHDLLFGRAMVFLGLHVDNFVRHSNRIGVPMRWSTRREAARMAKRGEGLYIDHCVPIVERGDKHLTVAMGIVLRMLFHGVTPNSAINILDRSVTVGDDDQSS